jgi:hypothetical protein
MALNENIIKIINGNNEFDKKVKSFVLHILEHEVDFTNTSNRYIKDFKKILEKNIDQEVIDL